MDRTCSSNPYLGVLYRLICRARFVSGTMLPCYALHLLSEPPLRSPPYSEGMIRRKHLCLIWEWCFRGQSYMFRREFLNGYSGRSPTSVGMEGRKTEQESTWLGHHDAGFIPQLSHRIVLSPGVIFTKPIRRTPAYSFKAVVSAAAQLQKHSALAATLPQRHKPWMLEP